MHELTPIGAATAADPYPYYARLVADRPFYRDGDLGLWIAASARAVEDVLRSDAMRVRPVYEPVPATIAGSPAGDLFARFMRMTDGAYHAARKREAQSALNSPASANLAQWAAECARAFPYRDVASLMHRFPAFAMAHAAGLSGEGVLKAADAAVEFARTFSRRRGTRSISAPRSALSNTITFIRKCIYGRRHSCCHFAATARTPRCSCRRRSAGGKRFSPRSMTRPRVRGSAASSSTNSSKAARRSTIRCTPGSCRTARGGLRRYSGRNRHRMRKHDLPFPGAARENK